MATEQAEVIRAIQSAQVEHVEETLENCIKAIVDAKRGQLIKCCKPDENGLYAELDSKLKVAKRRFCAKIVARVQEELANSSPDSNKFVYAGQRALDSYTKLLE